jgi:ABC-type transport system involved in cytochrome bd biosynthesis fused ATPase/permease subunit
MGSRGRLILDEVTLDVPMGSKIAVAGSSGSGKTALLHVLQGRLIPSSGTAKICGVPVGDLRNGERCRAYAPNHYFFAPTPREQLAIDALVDDEAIWKRLLEDLGANPSTWKLGLDTQALELCGSDWEALSLARTLLSGSHPELFLLDMPPAKCIKQVVAMPGTVICALPIEHVVESAQYFDQVIVMHHGRVSRSGSPARLAADLGSLSEGQFQGLPSRDVGFMESGKKRFTFAHAHLEGLKRIDP